MPARPSDHPADRIDYELGLVELNVVPALGGDHVAGARHELGQLVLRILKRPLQRIDRPVGRESEWVRKMPVSVVLLFRWTQRDARARLPTVVGLNGSERDNYCVLS